MRLLSKIRRENRGRATRGEPPGPYTTAKDEPAAEALSREADVRIRCKEARRNLAIGFSKILAELNGDCGR